MEYEVITLGDMIESIGEVKVKNIITDFKSIPGDRKNDVECFLHLKLSSLKKLQYLQLI